MLFRLSIPLVHTDPLNQLLDVKHMVFCSPSLKGKHVIFSISNNISFIYNGAVVGTGTHREWVQ